MLTFVGRRVLTLAPLLLVISIITFSLVYLVPGDPALRLAGDAATPEDVARIRAELGLDEPALLQYLSWLGDAVRLDLGSSIFTGEPVSSELARRFPVTASLVLVAVVFALLVGVPLGILAALRRGRATDRVVSGIVSFGLAMPSYWLAMVLIVTFGLTLRLFPVRGYTPFTESPGGWLLRLVLPGIAVGVLMAATLARQLRGALVDALDQDYVRTARATGLGPLRVVGKHALKNAAMPAITVLGLQVGYLFGGTVIVEQIFAVPGVGSYLINGIIGQDLPVIQGCVAVLAVLVLATNLLVDIAYGVVNPRVRVT